MIKAVGCIDGQNDLDNLRPTQSRAMAFNKNAKMINLRKENLSTSDSGIFWISIS